MQAASRPATSKHHLAMAIKQCASRPARRNWHLPFCRAGSRIYCSPGHLGSSLTASSTLQSITDTLGPELDEPSTLAENSERDPNWNLVLSSRQPPLGARVLARKAPAHLPAHLPAPARHATGGCSAAAARALPPAPSCTTVPAAAIASLAVLSVVRRHNVVAQARHAASEQHDGGGVSVWLGGKGALAQAAALVLHGGFGSRAATLAAPAPPTSCPAQILRSSVTVSAARSLVRRARRAADGGRGGQRRARPGAAQARGVRLQCNVPAPH